MTQETSTMRRGLAANKLAAWLVGLSFLTAITLLAGVGNAVSSSATTRNCNARRKQINERCTSRFSR